MARVDLMFPKRDVERAQAVATMFKEIGSELAGAKGSACLTASGSIQAALETLGLVEQKTEDGKEGAK